MLQVFQHRLLEVAGNMTWAVSELAVADAVEFGAIHGWPGVRNWPRNGGPFAESATGLATI